MKPFFEQIFDFDNEATNDLAIIAMEGAKDLGAMIDSYLVDWYNNEAKLQNKLKRKETFLVKNICPRFTTGDGKGMILETVRGKDVYILCDVGNYSIEYNMFGTNNRMSPDDHYCDLKRILGAIAGKASRISIIMPLLYGGRQHRRNSRESLDCAQMLRDMESLGVSDIITFDAHDPRVQNAVPLVGFDNFFAYYQIMKSLTERFPALKFDKNNLMVVSPDEGAMARNIYYSSVLGIDLGMFYKRRDYSTIINGRNPIVCHEYIGNSVEGKNIMVADDIIATGDSVIHLCKELKEKGAKDIFLIATYALFTEGVEKFEKAYKEGLFTAVISTNLTYTREDVLDKEWFISSDMSKFIAYIVSSCNQSRSLSTLLDPHDKINELMAKYNA